MFDWISNNFIVILIVVYLTISFIIYLLQDYFLFHPEKLSPEFEFEYKNLNFDEHTLEIKPGVKLSVLRFRAEKPIGVVLYLKGNSRSIKGWGKFAIDFVRYNYDVIMVDYRGFGKSTGKFSQQGIKNDLQLVYEKIKERVDEKYIVVYGRSLGSGFATKLASVNNPRMLILDAPYYSLAKIAGKYLPFLPFSILLKYPIPTYKWIKYVKCPIHIIHGTKDRLIPMVSSIKLSNINPEKTRLYPITGGGHNNLHIFESYHETLGKILGEKNPEGFDRERSSINFKKPKKKQFFKRF
ncbi:MAG: alpha/beta hydrolase [Bacteroidetes bacterium]|nr:alpha/beta hydrolase [Bacteroidota bacterium]